MDRYIIGKYSPENGTTAAVRKFRPQFSKRDKRVNFAKPYRITMSHLNLYRNTDMEIKLANFYPQQNLMRKYSVNTLSKRGVVISWSIANAAVKALIIQQTRVKGDLHLDSSFWT